MRFLKITDIFETTSVDFDRNSKEAIEFMYELGKELRFNNICELTVEKLDESFADIINVAYTAQMEDKLDEIALGKCSRSEALTDFYKTFDELYSKAKVEMVKQDPIKEDLGLCPDCGKPLIERKSRYGTTFVGCSGFPKCRYIKKEPKKKKGEENVNEQHRSWCKTSTAVFLFIESRNPRGE